MIKMLKHFLLSPRKKPCVGTNVGGILKLRAVLNFVRTGGRLIAAASKLCVRAGTDFGLIINQKIGSQYSRKRHIKLSL